MSNQESGDADGENDDFVLESLSVVTCDWRSLNMRTIHADRLIREQGGAWYEIQPEDAVLHSLLNKAAHIDQNGEAYCGSLSPSARVTLDPGFKRFLQIPDEAVTFAFAYPLSGMAEEFNDPDGFVLPEPDDDESVSAYEARRVAFAFITIGGFVYMDAAGNLCHAAAFAGPGDGLKFDPAVKISGSHAAALKQYLVSKYRFEPVTLQTLLDKGLHHFCWIVPEEGLPGFERRDNLWPHGAFMYVRTRFSVRCCTETAEVDCFYCRIQDDQTLSTKQSSWETGIGSSVVGRLGQQETVSESDETPTASSVGGSLTFLCRGIEKFRADLQRRWYDAFRVSDMVRKAQSLCLLKRAVAEVRTVRVFGHMRHAGEGEWYRLPDERRIDNDGCMWQKMFESNGCPVRLQLMQAEKRAQHGMSLRLRTHTLYRDLTPFKEVTREAKLWRKLRPNDLDGKANGSILVLGENSFVEQIKHAWFATPVESELNSEDVYVPPDAEKGKEMHLILPYESTQSFVSMSSPSELSKLGIGVELYFHQLFSLAVVFLLMGLIQLSNLFTNLSYWGDGERATSPDLLTTLQEMLLIGTTLGSRSRPFTLRQSAWTEFGTTLFMVVYLLILRYFNVWRARAVQEHIVTAADYTIRASGIKVTKDQTVESVATRFDEAVKESWRKQRGDAVNSDLVGHGEDAFLRASVVGAERARSCMPSSTVVYHVEGAWEDLPELLDAEREQKAEELKQVEEKARMLHEERIRTDRQQMWEKVRVNVEPVLGRLYHAVGVGCRAISDLTRSLHGLVTRLEWNNPDWQSYRRMFDEEVAQDLKEHHEAMLAVQPTPAGVARRNSFGGTPSSVRLSMAAAAVMAASGVDSSGQKNAAPQCADVEGQPMATVAQNKSNAVPSEPAASPLGRSSSSIRTSNPHEKDLSLGREFRLQSSKRQQQLQQKRNGRGRWKQLHAVARLTVALSKQQRRQQHKGDEPRQQRASSASIVGDHAFITFRYAADAAQARKAFAPRSLVSRIWDRIVHREKPWWFHPKLKVERAPEADDLIWENLICEEQRFYQWYLPSMHILITLLALVLAGNVLLSLTSDKIELAALGYIVPTDPPPLNTISQICFNGLWYLINTGVSSSLEGLLSMIIGFENRYWNPPVATTLGPIEYNDATNATTLLAISREVNHTTFLNGTQGQDGTDNLLEPLVQDEIALSSRAVLVTSLFISVVVSLINLILRKALTFAAQQERPSLHSRLEMRQLTLVGLVYVTNYVVILFLVHSPLSGGRENVASVLGSAFYDNRTLIGQSVSGCVDQTGVDIDASSSRSVDVAAAASNCIQVTEDVLAYYFSEGIRQLVVRLGETGWYDKSAGLIPQMIILAIVDAAMLVLRELLSLLMIRVRHFQAMFKHAQASVNAKYEPPPFIFADRYAYILKIAASVLVFAPAAPVLYFLGGSALLVSFFIEKLALVKFYRRPRSLDERVAERYRVFLLFFLFLHVVSSCIFFSQQAYVTHSRWDDAQLRPFAYAFVLWFAFMLLETFIMPWLLMRSVSEEESGADDRLYKDVSDEFAAIHGTSIPDFFVAARAEMGRNAQTEKHESLL